jgi:hypothetical protein
MHRVESRPKLTKDCGPVGRCKIIGHTILAGVGLSTENVELFI